MKILIIIVLIICSLSNTTEAEQRKKKLSKIKMVLILPDLIESSEYYSKNNFSNEHYSKNRLIVFITKIDSGDKGKNILNDDYEKQINRSDRSARFLFRFERKGMNPIIAICNNYSEIGKNKLPPEESLNSRCTAVITELTGYKIHIRFPTKKLSIVEKRIDKIISIAKSRIIKRN